MDIVNHVWYTIPDYPGYEVRFIRGFDQFEIRSFKNFKRYPEGYILPYSHKTSGGGVAKFYEMTQNTGYRKKLTIGDIYDILINKNHLVNIRDQYDTDIGSRLRTLPADRKNSKKEASKMQIHSAGSLFKTLISKGVQQ